MRKIAVLFCAAATLAAAATPAVAAGSAEGRKAAQAAAAAKWPGARLIAIEGLTGSTGEIPCGKSNAWTYEFHDGEQWGKVQACGNKIIKAAKFTPAAPYEEPVRPLHTFVRSSEKNLQPLIEDGNFSGATPGKRDILMRASWLPAEGERPAGCFWRISRGPEVFLRGCDGTIVWSESGGTLKAAKKLRGKLPAELVRQTAARALPRRLEAMTRRYRGAYLICAEAYVKPDGTPAPVPGGGDWAFMMHCPGQKDPYKQVELDETDCRDKNSAYLRAFNRLPNTFVDSDAALAALPDGVLAGCGDLFMKLQNFKTGHSPVPGRNFLWQITCGQDTHYVDAARAIYLGPGDK